MTNTAVRSRLAAAAALVLVAACSSAPPPEPPKASADPAFAALAGEYLEDLYKRQPTMATFLGVHKYDEVLDDYSRQAVTDAVAASKAFAQRFSAIDPASPTAR